MHKRLLPKVNAFTYGMYYLVFPLSKIDQLKDGWRFGVDRPGILAFRHTDHGDRTGKDLLGWIRGILSRYGIDSADGEVFLVTLPRVLGYVFNPVSFWMCMDHAGQLRAVLCEVNNTFGETHSYLCFHHDQRPIGSDDILTGEKVFHVSPFLRRQGDYQFRFLFKEGVFGTWIDYQDQDGKKLLTALTGRLVPYNRHSRRRAFWRYPLVTYRAIFLIHWQALKLIGKGVKYISKPIQFGTKISFTKEKQETSVET